jgi:hypothetical protein
MQTLQFAGALALYAAMMGGAVGLAFVPRARSAWAAVALAVASVALALGVIATAGAK